MKPMTVLALWLCLAGTGLSQTATFNDPANLAGERVKPRDGRELPIDQGASGLQQMLRRLSTRASILNIVAHPDDEDGGMLTFYSRGQGARVADLSLTRGEGGQNAMTGDFEDALGLLRTQELLACDRYSGIDQFFGTEVDFGFSKTKEEAFGKWTHERVLYDVVRAIRIYRPLVLTATFIGGVTDGHGQHQVSGEIAQEAFKAAGDPKVFPELTAEGIYPWQPLKIYARVPQFAISDKGLFDYATGQFHPVRFTNYVTGEVSTTPPSADIVVHEGETDPLLTAPDGTPRSYVQFARMGLAQQKSQIGPGLRTAPAGKFDVAYHRYGSCIAGPSTQDCRLDSDQAGRIAVPAHASAATSSSFFDGVDTSIPGLASLLPHAPSPVTNRLEALKNRIDEADHAFSADHPEACAPALASALDTVDLLMQEIERLQNYTEAEKFSILHELRIKRAQLNNALALSLGLTLDATTEAADLTAGSHVKVSARLQETSESPLDIDDIYVSTSVGGRSVPPTGDVHTTRPISADHPDQRTLTIAGKETLTLTRPYFFRNNIEQPVYQLRENALRNAPVTPDPLVVWATVRYRGRALDLGRVVHSAEQPVQFVPAVAVALSSSAQILSSADRAAALAATVRSNLSSVLGAPVPALSGKLVVTVSSGWTVSPATSPLHLGTTALQAKPLSSAPKPAELNVTAATANGDHIREVYRPVGYGDLPRTNYFTPATDRIVPVDLKLPAQRRIAYLPGTGDGVPEALASIGLKPEMLTVADLTPEKLKQFDTVVLGVRTYAAHPELHGVPTQALLDYARGGGNVVVQYQTLEFTAADAPYPITLAPSVPQGTVVDENAPVKLLDAASPLLSSPNRITPADFNGWIEERGHGFLRSWDPHYTAPTETHDPGSPSEGVQPQAPQRGGLITVQLGSGRWTYLAFAVYRQLPQAVPGAYRLFVNLLQK